ncbi:MAG TPA: sugar phosphate isomerase/epimerase family protein [Bacteroidales bacterium]|nr:sugar phosphate isomerase/epimerase family protein [Bacteroidales bacterium]
MTTTRRTFLKNSVLTGAGMFLYKGAFGNRPEKKPFLEHIGVCTSVTNSPYLAEAGFSYIEEGVQGFLVPQLDEKAFEEKLKLAEDAVLPVEACNSFLPGEMKCTGPEAVPDQILKFAETAFRRAKIAGVNTIVFGSSRSRNIPGGFPREKAEEQFAELGKRMADIAGRYNVVISLEPLNTRETNFINSVAEGGELVKIISHPNFRLLADIYHMMVEDESPENLITYGDLLYHTHIAEKEGRMAPGVKGEDFRPYFEALKKAKYYGRMSIECRWKDQKAEAPVALAAIRKQL